MHWNACDEEPVAVVPMQQGLETKRSLSAENRESHLLTFGAIPSHTFHIAEVPGRRFQQNTFCGTLRRSTIQQEIAPQREGRGPGTAPPTKGV